MKEAIQNETCPKKSEPALTKGLPQNVANGRGGVGSRKSFIMSTILNIPWREHTQKLKKNGQFTSQVEWMWLAFG